jgi:multidrug efflux pump
MRLWMDPDRLVAYGLTPLDVLNAVGRENIELPSGRVEGSSIELSVRTLGRLNTPEEFNNLVITTSGDEVVQFRDIGRAEYFPENERTILRRDGIPMVGVVVVTQPGSNSIAIADEFYARVVQIKIDLPEDISTVFGFDVTQYIRSSINEVKQTIIVAFLLVVSIIFLFLRDWRTTLIPVLTIPISLIGSFFIMYISGFSINVLTLLGIVLAIGLVVDDTIVVLENIYSKIEDGEDPKEAGKKGVAEIFFAVIATTVALAAVFLPVIFLQGLTGRLFREFGIVVAGAVIISSFVALTLTPMVCTRLLKQRKEHNFFYNFTEPFFKWMNEGYNRSLEAFMQFRWLSFVFVALSAGMIYFFMTDNRVKSELSPMEDRGEFRVMLSAQEGVTFEYMDAFVEEMSQLVQESIPEIESIVTVTSPGFGAASSVNSAFIRVVLVDKELRERTQQQIADALTPIVNQMTGAQARIIQPQSIGDRRGGPPVQYVIQAPTLEKLQEVLPSFLDEARQNPAFVYVDANLKFNKPEIRIEIDREKARNLGISVRDIAQTLQLSLSGSRFGYFIMDGKQYQVIGQLEREQRNEPLDLKSMYVRAADGQLIQMDNVVRLSESATPPQLYRYNRYVSATLSASMTPEYTLGQALEEMDKIADKVLDESFSTTLAGASKEFQESADSLYFAFAFALILIYLVLSAQFESFRDPFIIMFTVPLALAGALLTLWRFDETLNIFSQIGIIMLIGLVTKNGILIVEFANQRKAQGIPIAEAIVGAAQARFRPILMTSLSTILGILPIALALGAGAESRVSMGIAVIGGLIFSTLLTLYVIPGIYTYFTSKEARLARV